MTEQSLDAEVNRPNRWQMFGQRDIRELTILPYEAAGFIAGGTPGYFAGSKAGEQISQMSSAPHTPTLPTFGRGWQDDLYSLGGGAIGATILGIAAALGARYLVNRYKKK